ncbi:zinc ribbon domain-containing protein [Rhodocaloribacter litoris]|uniref:FmdB family zinc ribbon protein n=1 Tax=Rhodocaloribacter litoris TaxID=2558931 RepID=UPI00142241E7|nr:zinc ribbon domain-containing protein [Rhodocaloribacter litoris]QXD14886.1 zinc ribbon domain-containing protein [Rhodocaloribacter litoris]GIV59016.1 MAG: FmdB family transcriptional regulator [Rhodothermaceae bacterium]
MPTYVYKRADGTTFEIEQRISEPALTTCPTTGQPVTRLITGGAGLIFKGNGFYLTDYARKGNGAANGNAKGDTRPSTGGEPAASKKSETAST